MDYRQQASERILPLSVAATLTQAFREWRFTGHTEDHEEPVEICQLCGHGGLRYHFEIRNDHNNKILMVGSKCILRFNLAVYGEQGERLSTPDARKVLNKKIKEMHYKSCVKALEKLYMSDIGNERLKGALDYYRQKEYLTPKFARMVIWLLTKNKIDHDPRLFKVNTRKQKYRDDLCNMANDWGIRTIWKALSKSQKDMAIAAGYTPPPDANYKNGTPPPPVLG